MAQPTALPRGALEAELGRCLAAVGDDLKPSSLDRIQPTWSRFAVFIATTGALTLRDATAEIASAFVRSRLSSGDAPSVATMQNRRSAVRLLFRAARRLGLVDGDPTLDVVLPARVSTGFRPLTDDEIALGRDAAEWWMSSQRFSAVWALAEATARGAELGAVRVENLDLGNGQVWLSGGTRVDSRWAPLTEWGIAVLERRVASIGHDGFVAYRGTDPGTAGRISAASAITAVLTRAGLRDEPDIRPSSVAAWTGRTVFNQTGDIAAAAQVMGSRSLDHAARMIGWDWTA